MNGYEKRTQQKKETILDTAQKMLFTLGYSKVNITDIAKEANVSKVSVFKYFESKEILARAIMKRYINSYLSIWDELSIVQIPFIEKMGSLFGMNNSKSPLFIFSDISRIAWEDPFIRQLYTEESYCLQVFLTEFFQKGKDIGAFDASIPTDAILAYIQAMSSLLNLDIFDNDNGYVTAIQKLFFYGLWDNSIDN
ncbi:MAG: TetR/AcrR family transcriptional regulator [Mobilitalea sp.]